MADHDPSDWHNPSKSPEQVSPETVTSSGGEYGGDVVDPHQDHDNNKAKHRKKK